MLNRLALLALIFCSFAWTQTPAYDYRVLATTKTSTMEKEMNQAARDGYRFRSVMGGETAIGGKEVVVVMAKGNDAGEAGQKQYKLLATSRTATMQKELQQAADQGFEYLGQTVFESLLGGKEVSVILERDMSAAPARSEYRLLATERTSTMQKELREAGMAGFSLLGMSVGKTAFGGNEIVCILKRTAAQ